jgi:hypothetical protein
MKTICAVLVFSFSSAASAHDYRDQQARAAERARDFAQSAPPVPVVSRA